MPRSKTPNTKTAAARAKKRPVKKQGAWPNFLQRNSTAILFIIAFAAIGGIVMLFMTNAESTGSPIVSGVSTTTAKKCLDNNRNLKANGNKVQLYTCNGTAAQMWTLNSNGTITNSNGYCLDVKDQGKTPKTIVALYQCDQTVAQQWKATSEGTLVNPNSNLCLDDQYSSTANGAQIWIYTCNGTKAQKWTIQKSTTPTPPPSTGGGTGTGSGNSTSLEPSGQAMPSGNLTGWKQIFADNFSGTVPLGAFSDCDHNHDTPQAYCGGLKAYGNYYNNWWAYPSGWEDTAKSGADGNPKAPANSPGGKTEVAGQYRPEDTVSVGDGAMHIKMFRPSTGYQDNHVAAMVPRACMSQEYGRYVERFKVVHADPGFKSAHLFYDDGYEIDYPESDSYSDTFNAFTHYTSPSTNKTYSTSYSAGTQWTDGWHTTAIEWTSSSIKFYVDSKLIGTTTTNIPHIKMSWILQNESSILGPKFATPGNYAQMDLDWITCYAKS